MSLVAGRGPLGKDPAGGSPPAARRSRSTSSRIPGAFRPSATVATVIDTERALMVHRRDHPLSYAFPADEIGDLPGEPVAEAPGFVRVPWDAVDTWLEEGRRLVHYPPNPYHRVDCRPTNRGLRVDVAGTTLVDTVRHDDRVRDGARPRLYVDPSLVRTDLLRRSETSSYCNYKGYATYWTAVIGETVVDDVAWSYDEPLPETLPIKGYFSFDAPAPTCWRNCRSPRERRLRLRLVTRVTYAGATSVPTVASP